MAVKKQMESESPAKKADPREAEIRAGMKAGRFAHYYEKADGSLLQKIPIYFNSDEAVKLKIRAAQERRTVSDLVRRAMVDYLKKAEKL